jgi:hypothetical protein
MWDGPKLVTTPASDFATLCSLLFEAVSGRSDESLAGAINRYARSEDRRRWDEEGIEMEEAENDNFAVEKLTMKVCTEEITLCRALLQEASLSDMARDLLLARTNHEQRRYDQAFSTYGPRQVLLSHLNSEQLDNILIEAASCLNLEKIAKIDEQISSRKSLAQVDIELGKARRSVGRRRVDL